jgi:hypothetical protein
MNDRENNACQYVLESIDIFKDTSLLRDIQNFLIVEIFPITLDDYRIFYHGYCEDQRKVAFIIL